MIIRAVSGLIATLGWVSLGYGIGARAEAGFLVAAFCILTSFVAHFIADDDE